MVACGVAQQVQAGVHHLVQVVRRDIGGHADRNTAGAIHQQIGKLARQHFRFFFGTVVIVLKVDSFLVDIGQHFMRNFGQPDFRITHCGRVVSIHGAEVALAVDQHVAHGKVLRQSHDGVVDRLVAVRMVFTDHVTHDTGRFLVRPVPVVIEFVHGVQHAPVHGLEAVACIGKRPAHDHAHGVIEIAAAHFLFKTDGQGFFGEGGHEREAGGRKAKFYAVRGVAPPQHKAAIPPPSYASGVSSGLFAKDPMAQSPQRFGWWSLKASLIRSAAAAFSPRGEP
jgi:hypothetical protein